MDELKEMICRELDEIALKGEMSAGELDTVYKLIVAKEKLLKIEELEGELGYSQADGNWSAYGSYARGPYSRDGYDRNSYGNGYGNSYGRHLVRGHYSRGRYSMDDGRSMLADQIRGMMSDPSLNPGDKQVLMKAYDQLQR